MDADIVKEINTFAKLSLNTSIASMVANKNLTPPKTSFVQLRAIDNLYPFYGEFITTKGKGYEIAESNQTKWHAPGIFDKDTGIITTSNNLNTSAS